MKFLSIEIDLGTQIFQDTCIFTFACQFIILSYCGQDTWLSRAESWENFLRRRTYVDAQYLVLDSGLYNRLTAGIELELKDYQIWVDAVWKLTWIG